MTPPAYAFACAGARMTLMDLVEAFRLAGRRPLMGKPEKPETVRFYTELLIRVLEDSAHLCSIPASSIVRDICLIRRRSTAEGMSFLTKTLPSLGKCLDKALGSDSEPVFISSFELVKAKTHPKFLGAFWSLIFTEDEGGVDEDRQILAVRAVRQICFLLYKLEGSHSPESELEVISDFVATDQSLPEEMDEVVLSPRATDALENAQLLIWRTLRDLDPLDISPRHGPGSVATGEKPWEKMNFSRLYASVEKKYPFADYFFFNYTHLCDDLESMERLSEEDEATAKVTLVPKDSRGPRLISMEPLEIQWIQQGLARVLVRKIENPGSITSGYVNFTNQEVNRNLALSQSYDGEFITADMKEASDRVSLWLVRRLFPLQIFECLKACRSEYTLLPGDHRFRLRKFAPMGSAVCFPVEALVFWAVAVGSLTRIRSKADFDRLPKVYVYGDDLVLRKEDFATVKAVFEELHLKFNVDKCCTGRFFRESCGLDAFKLHCVTPLRVKTPLPERPSPTALLSYVSYMNSLQERGLSKSAEFLLAWVTKTFGPIPVTNRKDGYPLARKVDWSSEQVREHLIANYKSRNNKDLQREEVRIRVTAPRVFTRGRPDWSEMLRVGIRRSDPFGFDNGSLGPCRHTVPGQLKTRWRWVGLSDLLD